MTSRAALGVAAAVAIGALLGEWLDRRGPAPVADVARGSEGAFTEGLYDRELPPRLGPLRWTRPRARLRFARLPLGPSRLEVEVAGHRTPVEVAAGGARLGVLAPGVTRGEYALPALRARELEVELRTEGFEAGGRRLGTQLRRVALLPATGSSGGRIALLLAATAAAFALSAAAFGPAATAAVGAAGAGLAALLLWPWGLARSPWASGLCVSLVLGAVLARGVAAWWSRRERGAGAVYAAVLVAWVIQGILATLPYMVVSDAVFQANRLREVAGGELFPTSVTQHAVAFRIPYPPAFYLLLLPGLALGLDPVALVRWGAGLSGVIAALGLLWGLRRYGVALAGGAVVLLQLLPGTFLPHSYGNLSNVAAQSLFALLLAWWLAGAPGGWLLGAALAAGSALCHLSAMVVVCAFAVVLVPLAAEEDRGRALRALGGGVAAAALYYGGYAPLILEQLPRLLEGGSGAGTRSPGVLAALAAQAAEAVRQFGLPALVLAAFALPGPWRERPERGLLALLAAGLGLAAVALVSPLEVRYLYALTPFVALYAARGALRLAGRGRIGSALALLLLAAQAALAVSGFWDGVLLRYRL